MKKFSQSFILYHGCGRCYLDKTNELIANKVQCRQIILFGKDQKILLTEFQNQQEVN